MTAPDTAPSGVRVPAQAPPVEPPIEALADRVRRLVILWAAQHGPHAVDGRAADIIAAHVERPDVELGAVARAAIAATNEVRSVWTNPGGTQRLQELADSLKPGAGR